MNDPTKTYSIRQEKMVAEELGGYPVGGSGAMPGAPGDVKTWDWLVECKTHTDPGHNIFFNADVWTKIQQEAMGVHRKPVLIVDDGSQKARNTWCVCRAANLNLAGVITVDLPVKIRKNITCKVEKLADSLKASSKNNVIPGTFYEYSVFEADWCGESVIVCPLKTFKELFDK